MPSAIPSGPFASLRDYMAALEARGKVLRIAELDQDAYEATGLMYRLIERYGWTAAPAVIVDRVRQDGAWIQGPLVFNQYGDWDCEAIGLGVEPGPDRRGSYRAALAHCASLAVPGTMWKSVPPVEVPREAAPCKQVILRGEAIDLLRFPFLRSNPADGGRFINTGNLVLVHPEQGRNIGTYRCHIKGPRRIGVNPEVSQHMWTMLNDLKAKGHRSWPVAVVLGSDPILFAMSSSKTARYGQDEAAIAGGFLGRPVEMVRCEGSDIQVPAHAEMILEGEVRLDESEPEGPFGEMYGYMGARKAANFVMDVQVVTHRRDPWFVNQFTGVTRGFLTSPMEATANIAFRGPVPNLVGIHLPVELTGFCFVSIDKKAPGDAFRAGEAIVKFLNLAKITCVVDKDVDILDGAAVLHAVGARWRPHPATRILEATPGMRLDPGVPESEREKPDVKTSKIIIDATRPWPGEGGPQVYPKLNRECLVEACPDVFARVDAKLPGWLEGFDS